MDECTSLALVAGSGGFFFGYALCAFWVWLSSGIEERLDRLMQEQEIGRVQLPGPAERYIDDMHRLVFEEGVELSGEQETRVREIYRENLGDFE